MIKNLKAIKMAIKVKRVIIKMIIIKKAFIKIFVARKVVIIKIVKITSNFDIVVILITMKMIDLSVVS